MSQQVAYLLDFSRAQTSATSPEAVDLTTVVNSALDTLAEPLDDADAIVNVGELPLVTAREVPSAERIRQPDQERSELSSPRSPAEVGDRSNKDDRRHPHNPDRQRRPASMLVIRLGSFSCSSGPLRTRRGTGIGLALSRRIVEAYGGEIGVEEGTPVGTVFWLELPEAVAA